MLDALSHIRAYTNDLYFVFTVQEELGLRGSKPAAYSIDPDYGIAVDVTVGETWDDPQKGSSILGDGAAVKIMDSSVICHPDVIKLLETLAMESKIPFQRDVIVSGGTREGVRTGGISIPCRYLHSPVEMVDLSDVTATVRLMTAFAQKKL